MRAGYKQLKESVQARINPDNIPFSRLMTEDMSLISYSDVLQYIRLAMKGVEPAYTQTSKDAGEAVKTHLNRALSDVSFAYQGSVMSNTHVKART